MSNSDAPALHRPWPVPPGNQSRCGLWLRFAWMLSGLSDAGCIAGAAVAVRRGQDYPALACAGTLPLAAPEGLVSRAAREGVSLRDTTCFLWPDLSSQGLNLLLEAGIREIVIPDLLVPQRLEAEHQQIRWKAASQGVQLVAVDPEDIFSPLREALQ